MPRVALPLLCCVHASSLALALAARALALWQAAYGGNVAQNQARGRQKYKQRRRGGIETANKTAVDGSAIWRDMATAMAKPAGKARRAAAGVAHGERHRGGVTAAATRRGHV